MSFVSLTEQVETSGTEIFLDTSIHCSRLKGPLFKDRIDSVLKRFRWIGTSSYAKTEFGNVVLAQAEYFLRKLTELGSVHAVLDFIGNVLPHRLHPKKVTWSFNLLRNHYGNDDAECTERATCSLTLLMKVGVRFVEKLCDEPIADGTCCYWARKGVHKRQDGKLVWKYPICKRDNKRCRLDDFFVENQELFARIKDAIDNLPNERKTDQLEDFSRIIGLATKEPQVLLDYESGCKRLADAIIAVDSVGYKNMFSQNERESAILCAILGQDFFYLPPNLERGVLLQKAQ